MPYYIFNMSTPDGARFVKNLELLAEYEKFRDAKQHAKSLRAEQGSGSSDVIKVMFAESQLHAEEQLLEHRDKPVLMEHER
ncbi:MAG: hypothetical protein AAF420_04345 [Pseudomonadota bacterium]